jgi:hypothetical protein
MRSSTRPLAALVFGLGLVVAAPLSASAVAVHTTLELQEPTTPALGGPDTRVTLQIGNPDVRVCIQRPGITAGATIRGFNPQPDPPGEPTGCTNS